jgi:DNA-binding CsgD family transcriptional regulator
MPSGWAAWERAFGDLARAEELARYGVDLMLSAGAASYASSLQSTLGVTLIDRGRIAEAEEVLSAIPAREGGAGIKETHAFRARLRLLQRRHEEALAEIETELARERERGWRVGNRGDSRTLYVQILAALERIDEARAAADAEVELAVQRGVAGAEARARLSRATTLTGAEAVEELRGAVEAARRSPSLKLQAGALVELGAAIRRSGERAEARPLLTEARELAHRCGATGTEEHAHEELMVAGGRPQRMALSGVESLTAAERRVAELAAQGLKNRDIAEALFVTLKTVEVHLGHTYAKLDIKGRSQLAAALERDG